LLPKLGAFPQISHTEDTLLTPLIIDSLAY
jgi:hypothetical protein